MAVIASSVQGILVHLGYCGVLGALSDSVEPFLLEELPLVSVDAISYVISLVSVVDELSRLLCDVPLVVTVLLPASEPVSGTLS